MNPINLPIRCGIDAVEIERVARLIRETPADDLPKLFSETELEDGGDGSGRAASLAARFAAKEACLKLFPRETALGTLTAEDFSVTRDGYGAPMVVCNATAKDAMLRNGIAEISVSLTHSGPMAVAIAIAIAGPR
jgi:holo-[acyl-carrier protein] synthase